MKRNCVLILYIFLITASALVSCKKTSQVPDIINLSQADTGKVVTLQKGKIISITLGNPGDGGYTFNTWQYDPAILHLDTHKHIPPTNTQLTGDFGKDTWQFTAQQSGTTTLSMSVSRGTTDTVGVFTDTIKVQ